MKIKESIGSRIFDVCNVLFMLLFIVIMLYPMLNVIAISLSSADAVDMGRVTFYPIGLNLKGYETILSDPMIGRAYINTIFYAAASTVLTLLFTSMIAYSLAVSDFILKKPITIMLAITMFFGGGMIPSYLVIKNLHLTNTIWALLLPGCVSAYNVIVFRTFFQGLPDSLRESAMLDGANDFTIMFRIYMPLSKALLATFALFTIVGTWNSWFSALIYLADEKLYPLQMILRKILFYSSEYMTSEAAAVNALANGSVNPKNVQMASIIVVTGPILVIYPFLQKYFVKGMVIGAIKG